MRTCYVFQSDANPNLRGFTDSSTGEKLPADSGPWTFVQRVNSDEQWTFNAGRAIVSAGILENGFLLWEESNQAVPFHPVIESDRVEGTAVFNQQGKQTGTIKRLLIEKVSGRVLYVDVTFGGFSASAFTIAQFLGTNSLMTRRLRAIVLRLPRSKSGCTVVL